MHVDGSANLESNPVGFVPVEPKRDATGDRPRKPDETDQSADEQARLRASDSREREKQLFTTARRAWIGTMILDQAARLALIFAALGAGTLALIYVAAHADDMSTNAVNNAGEQHLLRLFMSLTLPAMVLTGLAILAGVSAWLAHQRGVEAFERGVQTMRQSIRDAYVPVKSREIEEQIGYARKAFAMQLWLSRLLFIISLGLFTGAVGYSIAQQEIDFMSVGLAAGSLAATLWGTAKMVPGDVTRHLASIVEIQVAVDALDRQLQELTEAGHPSRSVGGGASATFLGADAAADNSSARVDTAVRLVDKMNEAVCRTLKELRTVAGRKDEDTEKS
jgi:hypothetical protein